MTIKINTENAPGLSDLDTLKAYEEHILPLFQAMIDTYNTSLATLTPPERLEAAKAAARPYIHDRDCGTEDHTWDEATPRERVSWPWHLIDWGIEAAAPFLLPDPEGRVQALEAVVAEYCDASEVKSEVESTTSGLNPSWFKTLARWSVADVALWDVIGRKKYPEAPAAPQAKEGAG